MPALPTYADAVSLGSITQVNNEFTQLSGLAASRKNPGIVWGHNDGNTTSTGGSPREFIALNRARQVKGRFSIVESVGSGWEDVALGPGPTVGVDYLYFGPQMGGAGLQPSGGIVRVPEPTISESGAYQGSGGSVAVTGGVKMNFDFADASSHSCEAFCQDPITNDIYIIMKGLQNDDSETGMVYKFTYAQQQAGGTAHLALVADLDISWQAGSVLQVTHDTGIGVGENPRSQVTGADISQDGQWIVVRTRAQDAWVWKRPSGGLVEDAWGSGSASNRKGAGAVSLLMTDSQESVCFVNYQFDGAPGSTTSDGNPGGLYGAAEGGGSLWYNAETVQPSVTGSAGTLLSAVLGAADTQLGMLELAARTGGTVQSRLDTVAASVATLAAQVTRTARIDTSGSGIAAFDGRTTKTAAMDTSGASTSALSGSRQATGAMQTSGSGSSTFDAQKTAQAAFDTAGSGTAGFDAARSVGGDLSTSGSSTSAFTGAVTRSGSLIATGLATSAFTADVAGAPTGDMQTSASATATFSPGKATTAAFASSGAGTSGFAPVRTLTAQAVTSGSSSSNFAPTRTISAAFASSGSATSVLAPQKSAPGAMTTSGTSFAGVSAGVIRAGGIAVTANSQTTFSPVVIPAIAVVATGTFGAVWNPGLALHGKFMPHIRKLAQVTDD